MVYTESTFRPATGDDALCISVLAAQVFVSTYATLGIREAIARHVTEELSVSAIAASIANSDHRFIVAEISNHLVGFVQMKLRTENSAVSSPNAAEVVRLYVLDRFTSNGVGTSLLTRAEALAVAQGAQHAWLTAWVGNSRALAFYPRRGYTDLGATTFVFQGENIENRLFVKALTVRLAPQPAVAAHAPESARR
jgi:ribosomal protein S18 acetylase RimI-like enzyme